MTIFSHGWVESLTGFDPDHHNGAFEWLIVGWLFIASGLAGAAARAERRRHSYASYVPL